MPSTNECIRRVCLALFAGLALVCGQNSASADEGKLRFYLMSFDRFGQLSSPYERDLAIRELQSDSNVRRILLIAYGWANDGESSLGAYTELVDDLLARIDTGSDDGDTVIFGIGWDSSQTGFRKLFNDLVPLPVIADAAAVAPDRLLFPFSFWSKAAMADRIGFGGLRRTLNQILGTVYPPGTPHPPIYLVGHSFGTRVLSGLLKNRVGMLRVGRERFRSTEHVAGALFIQPSLVLSNLPVDPPFPVIVTQNEHDHANGILFPLGNLLVNSYVFTTFEGLLQYRLFSAFEGAAGSARDTVLQASSMLLPIGNSDRTKDSDLPQDAESPESSGLPHEATSPNGASEPREPAVTRGPEPAAALGTRAYGATRRTSGELLAIPIAVGFSLVATPIQYAYTQAVGIASNPVDHTMDSLAQLPLIELGVDALSHLLGRERPWGRASKGIFTLGGLHESAGRLLAPSFGSSPLPVATSYRTFEAGADGAPCGLSRCIGIQFVDLSDEIGQGLFGDLRNPWIRYSIGWLDPVGMHSQTRESEIRSLLGRLLTQEGARISRSPHAAASTASPEVPQSP